MIGFEDGPTYEVVCRVYRLAYPSRGNDRRSEEKG
jgi:hypothetical protein